MAAPWEEKYEKAPDAAPAKTVAAPSLPPATATPEGLFKGETSSVPANMPSPALERVEQNTKQAVSDVGGASQDFLTNHPGLLALPAAYGAHKVADKIGLYGTLADKLKSKSTAEPAPSRNPLPIIPDSNNAWDIHNEPPLLANETPEPKVSTFDEKRAAARRAMWDAERTPTLAPSADAFVGPPEFIGPRRPVAPVETPVTPTAPSDPLVADTTPPDEQPTEKQVKTRKTNVAQTALNPAEVPGQPGMRENYTKPKGINPATGKEYIGPGGYNWLHTKEGKRSPGTWKNLFGEKNVPYDEVVKRFREYELLDHEPGRGLNESPMHAMGGTYTKPKFIPEYIKGAVSPGALAATAGLATIPGLGMAAYETYKKNPEAAKTNLKEAGESLKSLVSFPAEAIKEAKEGKYSKLIELSTQIASGFLPPPVQAAFQTLGYTGGLNTNEDEELARLLYKNKVGAGRGTQGIPPPK